MRCPKCDLPLSPVPNSTYLNGDQWDAVKAGDWFREWRDCTLLPSGYLGCPVQRVGADPRYRYALDSDLEKFNDAEAARHGWL